MGRIDSLTNFLIFCLVRLITRGWLRTYSSEVVDWMKIMEFNRVMSKVSYLRFQNTVKLVDLALTSRICLLTFKI